MVPELTNPDLFTDVVGTQRGLGNDDNLLALHPSFRAYEEYDELVAADDWGSLTNLSVFLERHAALINSRPLLSRLYQEALNKHLAFVWLDHQGTWRVLTQTLGFPSYYTPNEGSAEKVARLLNGSSVSLADNMHQAAVDVVSSELLIKGAHDFHLTVSQNAWETQPTLRNAFIKFQEETAKALLKNNERSSGDKGFPMTYGEMYRRIGDAIRKASLSDYHEILNEAWLRVFALGPVTKEDILQETALPLGRILHQIRNNSRKANK